MDGEVGMKEIIIEEKLLGGVYAQEVRGELVRCKDCKHRPKQTKPPKTHGCSIVFPEGSRCPCQCEDDEYCSWYPSDDWFCPNGEKA